MDIDDAAGEFLGWSTFQQVDALGSTDTYTAAALLTRSPEPLRKELLGMLEPYMAANIVQVGCCVCGLHVASRSAACPS
jgi:hypothetical protein